MAIPQIVIDTNVITSAFKSRRGASYRLLSLIDSNAFELNLSVPLLLEYEDVLNRPAFGLSVDDVNDVLDYICEVGKHRQIHYLWRPYLNDPKDDMVLEVAVTAGCDYIVTFNERDFCGSEQFGLQIVRPLEFLRITGELK